MDHGRCLLLAVKSSCDLLFLHMYRFCWLMAPPPSTQIYSDNPLGLHSLAL